MTNTTSHEEAFRAQRELSGRTGWYSQDELDGLSIARIDDEISKLTAGISALRAERRKLVKRLGQ